MNRIILTTFVAIILWLGIGLAVSELINLNRCEDLREGLRQFQGRELTEQEARIKLKLEEWLARAKCEDQTK